MQRPFPVILVALLVAVAVVGCSHPARIPAVPPTLSEQAHVPGLPPNARFYTDGDPAIIAEAAIAAAQRSQAYYRQQGIKDPERNLLAISGGGDNGAFGAGLLLGWTDAGDRPEFDVVTGISTGALTAPFAFLGPDYDDELKEVYTTISADNVMQERSPFAAFFNDAMTDNEPLFEMVSRYADADMLAKIAREYEERGRLLLIGTTDLDASRTRIWNMSAIAASDYADRVNLFRRILVASAAIPGVFPPAMIDVEVDGRRYQEMHVDGGARSQAFAYPTALRTADIIKQERFRIGKRNLYIIRNDREAQTWASVDRQTLAIAGRAVSSLIHKEGMGDLFEMYLLAERDGMDFNLAIIGEEFTTTSEGMFEPAYMNALFDYGYQLARDGYPWRKLPPGFEQRSASR